MVTEIASNFARLQDWLSHTKGILRCILVGLTISITWLVLAVLLLGFVQHIGIDVSSVANYILLFSALLASHIVYCLFHKLLLISLGALRSSLAALGLQKWQFALPNIGIGILIGAIAQFAILFISIFLGATTFIGFSWIQRDPTELLASVIKNVFGFFSTAAWEETVFRGFVLQATQSTEAYFYLFAAISSALFACPHAQAFATEFGVALPLGYCAAFLGGMMFSQAARLRNSLWLSIGLHWAWDVSSAVLKGTGNQIGDPSVLVTSSVSQFNHLPFILLVSILLFVNFIFAMQIRVQHSLTNVDK